MPIYEYKCSNCGHQFERIQKFSDDPLKKCPKCDKNTLNKLISSPSFRLKGSGWYETDFKTGSKKNIAENGKSETKKKESNEQSSDSKSDKKKEKKKDNSSKTD